MSSAPYAVNARETGILARELSALHADAPDHASLPFDSARAIARMMGVAPGGTDSSAPARFVFWTPEAVEEGYGPGAVQLELTDIDPATDLSRRTQRVHRERTSFPMHRVGTFSVLAVDGIRAGARDAIGTLYRVRLENHRDGSIRYIVDPLAASVPFGAAAPAEVYDLDAMFAHRGDRDYFATVATHPDPDGVARVAAPVSLLEVHIPTATAAGTIAGFTRALHALGEGDRDPEELSPADRALLDYEAIQLMPIEPTILFEDGEAFWVEEESTDEVVLSRPYSTNWGYDVITAASPAVNPALLETGRPDELLDLVVALHTFRPRPIKLVLDVVYGHADNQTQALLNRHYFAGANMYGQNLNYRHPIVRAVLLEMQRRKSNYGVDGVRVDGAQDFRYWVADEDRIYHDDDYLTLMNDVKQEVANRTYRPWMIFEDGRPWPRDDWELASSYRAVTEQLPRVVQWGPLTFAHNTPFLFTFWISKWWRIREMVQWGANWITGTSNHDTLRRGTQIPPDARINTWLGATRPEIFENGYDNPAAHVFDAVMPGIPMDFLNANLHGPWSFVRNTDHRWAIKVASEEAYFIDWAVTPARFAAPWAFPRLKRRGFHSIDDLSRFMRAMYAAVTTTEYAPDHVAAVLRAVSPPLPCAHDLTGATLQSIAREWMDDVHEFCNLDHYRETANTKPGIAERLDFAQRVRAFRSRERWLAGNMQGPDTLEVMTPVSGAVVMASYRERPEIVESPDGQEAYLHHSPHTRCRAVVMIAHLEGAPIARSAADLLPAAQREALSAGEWRCELMTPRLVPNGSLTPDQTVELHTGDAVLWVQPATDR